MPGQSPRQGNWHPVLKQCRQTSMIMTSMVIGLLGGLVFIATVLQLPKPPAPMTSEDVIPLVSAAMLFATFFPLSIALAVGRAILEWIENGET